MPSKSCLSPSPTIANDRERLARFQREAEVLASLNHPNIATIHGLEESEGSKALVLELIEGETLAERLKRASLSVEEALEVCKQIAEALEAAHEKGIIHRDLKPGNVKITPEGKVKVLDFGLAKAALAESTSATSASQLADSPTITADYTKPGTILGTAAYMSPEQARGKPVDKRTDIWSFGCVLFECLSGKGSFTSNDVTDTLAAVLRSEPKWEGLPVKTPTLIRRLIQRCLKKSPEQRLHDIADARLELEEELNGDLETLEAAADPTKAASSIRVPLAVAAIVMTGIGLVMGTFLGRSGKGAGNGEPRPASALVTRTEVRLPEGATLALTDVVSLVAIEIPAVALSPDGRHLVYVGKSESGTRLYHRDLTRFGNPRVIQGTEGAVFAFFSPNSLELGFLTPDRVKKVSLNGGEASPLCRARTPVSANWIGDTIYVSDLEGFTLNSVPATGGIPSEVFDVVERTGVAGRVSSVLPGGESAFVSVGASTSLAENRAEIRVCFMDGANDKNLSIAGFGARYLSSGHLIFGRDGSVWAAPFDINTLEVTGQEVAVLGDVATESTFGNVHAAFADGGTVAFVPGKDLARGRLGWVDREGNSGVFDMQERVYGVFDVAPNDRQFAVEVLDVQTEVLIWDAESGARALPHQGSVFNPIWSPSGKSLALTAVLPGTRTTKFVLYDLETGKPRELALNEPLVYPFSWPLEEHIGITKYGPTSQVGVLNLNVTNADLDLLPRGDESGSLGVWGAALSRSGAWLAYASHEGGRYQVWIEQVHGGVRRQVSTDGGLEPVWCRTRDELFYRQGNQVLASRITMEPQLQIDPPEVVFEAPGFVETKGISYRVSSDGQRLFYIRRSESPSLDTIHIVQNWIRELPKPTPSQVEAGN